MTTSPTTSQPLTLTLTQADHLADVITLYYLPATGVSDDAARARLLKAYLERPHRKHVELTDEQTTIVYAVLDRVEKIRMDVDLANTVRFMQQRREREA